MTMKKIMLSLMSFGAMYSINAQKINLGKAAGTVSNGAKALTFTNEDAIKLSKESVDWMDKNNPVAGPKDPYTVRLNKLFGKHKLAERISPKKTWEGSVIGFIFTMLTAVVIWKFFYPNHTLQHWFLVTGIVGIFAQIGDLFESHLKRSVKVKDSSNLIPGHGGALDRFDSILFAVPALYIFLYLVSIF